jgi:nucleoid DNA-binding protein
MFQGTTTSRSILSQYDYYCKNTVSGLQVDKKQFRRVLGRFSILVADKLMEAEEVKLPIIGTLRIKKKKMNFLTNKLKIDFKATKEAGKKIYHLNEDRNNYFYKFCWRKARIQNIGFYSFVPERYSMKRRLAKLLKTDNSKDFFEN